MRVSAVYTCTRIHQYPKTEPRDVDKTYKHSDAKGGEFKSKKEPLQSQITKKSTTTTPSVFMKNTMGHIRQREIGAFP